MERKNTTVFLTGPSHPLLFKPECAHQMGFGKEVRVDPESVNSVLLDRFPLDNHEQWLVAAHVGMSSNGSALMLRNTSLLPNQHGLGALLSMIFAPVVEMRCDLRRRHYIGALVGLGHRDKDWGRTARRGGGNKSPKVSYYGEHDIELCFDVEIDNHDLHLINKVCNKCLILSLNEAFRFVFTSARRSRALWFVGPTV